MNDGSSSTSDPGLAALEAARAQAAAVRQYLEAIVVPRRRPRRQEPESIAGRLEAIAAELADADPATRRQLQRERRDLRARLRDLEAQFATVGADYAERVGIRHETWVAVGVPARVLRMAGITPEGSPRRGATGAS